mmetsp:Transcript_110366/g.276310  ORF Transcript_110366/g.276310 Transcript_110366/m.276310 type:complete len:247 (+) Transcript_110366:996-1736(+)
MASLGMASSGACQIRRHRTRSRASRVASTSMCTPLGGPRAMGPMCRCGTTQRALTHSGGFSGQQTAATSSRMCTIARTCMSPATRRTVPTYRCRRTPPASEASGRSIPRTGMPSSPSRAHTPLGSTSILRVATRPRVPMCTCGTIPARKTASGASSPLGVARPCRSRRRRRATRASACWRPLWPGRGPPAPRRRRAMRPPASPRRWARGASRRAPRATSPMALGARPFAGRSSQATGAACVGRTQL